MKQSKLKSIIVVVCTILFSAAFLSPIASAEAIDKKVEKQFNDVIQEEYGLTEEEVIPFISDLEKASAYYTYDANGDLEFNSEEALANNVNTTLVAEITDSLSKLKEFKSETNGISTFSAKAKAACKGINTVDEYQKRYYINSCNSDDLAFMLTLFVPIGTVVSFILGFLSITAGAAYLLATAIAAVGAASLTYYNSKGCGVWGFYKADNPTMLSQTCS